MPGLPDDDVRDAEDLVERARDPTAVHEAGRSFVGRAERAPRLDAGVPSGARHVLPVEAGRERARLADDGRAGQVVVVPPRAL